jgi:hypothetical protein
MKILSILLVLSLAVSPVTLFAEGGAVDGSRLDTPSDEKIAFPLRAAVIVGAPDVLETQLNSWFLAHPKARIVQVMQSSNGYGTVTISVLYREEPVAKK